MTTDIKLWPVQAHSQMNTPAYPLTHPQHTHIPCPHTSHKKENSEINVNES